MATITEHAQKIKTEFGHILNGRVEAGEHLALTGQVKQTGPDSYEVASATEAGKTYQVRWNNALSQRPGWVCDCPDHAGSGYHPVATIAAFGDAEARPCKHIIASFLVYCSGEQPPAPAYDLVIATKKQPFVTAPDGVILWYKRPNCEMVKPSGKRLTDPDIQRALGKYRLVATEARQNEVIRRYVLAGGAV